MNGTGPREDVAHNGHMATARSGTCSLDLEPLVLTVPQAAKRLQISKSNAYSLVRAGELPHVRLRGRVLVPVRALDAWLESQSRGGRR